MSAMGITTGFMWKVCLMSDREIDTNDDNINNKYNKIHKIACESVLTQVRKLNNIYH